MPYQPPQHLFDFQERGKYFARQATADPAWMARHHLDGPGLANGRWRALPQAKVLQIQARGESHRFDPMELIATREELAQLLALVPECDYLVFPEDRRFPIRRYGDLPVRWARLPAEEVERPRFAGQAQPGEYRVLCFSVEHVRRKEAHCQCVARHQRPGIQGWKAYQRRGGVLPEPSRPRLAGAVLDAGVFGRAWPGSPPLAGRPRSVGCPRHIPGRCAGEAERPSRDRRPRRIERGRRNPCPRAATQRLASAESCVSARRVCPQPFAARVEKSLPGPLRFASKAMASRSSGRQASVASSGKTTRYSNIRRTRRPMAWPCSSKAAWNSMAASYTRSASGPPAQPPSGAIVAPSTPGLRPGLAGSPLARDPKSQTGQRSPVYICLRPRAVCSVAPPDRPSPRSIGERCPCSLFSMPGRVMKRKYASPCWRNRFARF